MEKMDSPSNDRQGALNSYIKLVSQAFVAKLLADMVADLIQRDEFGNLPMFREFCARLLAMVDAAEQRMEGTLPLAHWYEPEGEAEFQFRPDGEEKHAVLNARVHLVFECKGAKASFPIHIAAHLHGFLNRSCWDDAEVTFTLPDGARVRYYGRHVEATFIERLP